MQSNSTHSYTVSTWRYSWYRILHVSRHELQNEFQFEYYLTCYSICTRCLSKMVSLFRLSELQIISDLDLSPGSMALRWYVLHALWLTHHHFSTFLTQIATHDSKSLKPKSQNVIAERLTIWRARAVRGVAYALVPSSSSSHTEA